MDELEEFEFRARAEAEAEAEAKRQPQKQSEPSDGSMWSSAAGWVGRQLSRVPAAIRGGVQALQTGDPRSNARNPIAMASRGFMDPDAVQTSGEMMARAGVSTEPKMQVWTPPPDAAIMARNMNLPPPLADTTYTTPAEEMGTAFDVLAPTGLEFVPPPLLRAMGASGRGMQRAGTEAIQSSLKPSRQLQNIPVPYNSENFLTPRPGAPEGGLASVMGKGRTMENIEALHDRLGTAQDALLQQMPEVDLLDAIANASRDIEEAISRGGNQALGLSARDAAGLRAEINHWSDAAERVSPSGTTNGVNARQFRGSLGHEARYNGSEATNARRVVAATIRERLNEQIGRLSPEFREIDRQFAETIPLRNALADALGREGNRYPIGLRTSMVIASGGASIPAELAKIATIEGTSRFAPQVALAKTGRAIANTAEAARPAQFVPIPLLQAAKFMRERDQERKQELPPFLQRPQ